MCVNLCVFCPLQENPLENLNTAFDVAANHLDIPRMLVAEGLSAGCAALNRDLL